MTEFALVHAPTPQEEVHPPAPAPGPGPVTRRRSPATVLSRAPGTGAVPPLTGVPALPPPTPGGGPEEEADRLAAEWAEGPVDVPAWVRVLHGPRSAALTVPRGLDAVTIGRDVHLAPGHPPLRSTGGRLLLAHELVHVAQQGTGRAPYGVGQGKPARKRRKGAAFDIEVTEEMGSEQLLREFVRQYYRLERPQDVDRVVAGWHWVGRPRSATAADVARGRARVTVFSDPADQHVAALSKADRDAVNAETDRRFAEQTGLPLDTRLGSGPEDAELRARWRGVRANLVAEQEQARALRALPADIQKILFAGGRTITPDEYGAALALAERIARLSPTERAAYLARVNASTDDLAELEASIARFERHLRMRAWDEEAFEASAAPLVGMEELYGLWKAKEKAERDAVWGPVVDSMAMPAAATLSVTRYVDPLRHERAKEEAVARFRAALARSRFATEGDFLAAVRTFRDRFRTQTVNLAMDVLARHDHLLHVAKLRYRDTDAAQRLVAEIATRGAATDYRAAEAAEAHADLASMPLYDDKPGGPRLYPGNPIALRAEAEKHRAAGAAKVVAASGSDPIIDPDSLGRRTDRELLAGATPEQAREHLLEMVEDRLQDTAKVRAELTEDPDRVFSLPTLVAASMEHLDIAPDDVYGQIVRDHMAAVRREKVFSEVVLGLIGVILAVLVPGGGWVAAAALVAGAGISAYQAADAIAEYNKGRSEHALGFINEEPSLFWVGVAVVGAAFELGTTVTALLRASAPALLKLRTPLTEFAAAGDVETAAARLNALNAQIDAVEGLEKQVRMALKAQAQAELAFKQALQGGGKLRASVLGLEPVFELLYLAVKRGVTRVTALSREKDLIAAFRQVTRLEAGASMEELTVAYRRVREVVKVGEKAGMDEATVLGYVKRLADQHGAGEDAFKALVKEVRGWRPPSRELVLAEARVGTAHDELLTLRNEIAALKDERAALKAGDQPRSRERLAEIDKELEKITGVDQRTNRPLGGGGQLQDASARFDDALLQLHRAGVDPVEFMRRAFSGSAVRDAVAGAAKGVDQVGGLLRSSGAIEVDHIVSLKRMSGMEGFDKLTLGERRLLAVRADNLVAMDAAANGSKWHRSWSGWQDAGRFYRGETVVAMQAKDAMLTTRIQNWILEQVRGR